MNNIPSLRDHLIWPVELLIACSDPSKVDTNKIESWLVNDVACKTLRH